MNWLSRLFRKPKPLPKEEWSILKGLEKKCVTVRGEVIRDAVFEYFFQVRRLEKEGYDVEGQRYYIENLMKRLKR